MWQFSDHFADISCKNKFWNFWNFELDDIKNGNFYLWPASFKDMCLIYLEGETTPRLLIVFVNYTF